MLYSYSNLPLLCFFLSSWTQFLTSVYTICTRFILISSVTTVTNSIIDSRRWNNHSFMSKVTAIEWTIWAGSSPWLITTILDKNFQLVIVWNQWIWIQFFVYLTVTIIIIDISKWNGCTAIQASEIYIWVVKRSLCKIIKISLNKNLVDEYCENLLAKETPRARVTWVAASTWVDCFHSTADAHNMSRFWKTIAWNCLKAIFVDGFFPCTSFWGTVTR